MAKVPAISVVMPAYNVENYIEKAIDSVQKQTFTDWELVIANDCSTDSTLDIVKRYASEDSRIRFFTMPEQSGNCYLPRKTAILNAKAELISPLDADDWIDPDYLDGLAERRASTGAVIAYPLMIEAGSEPRRVIVPTDESVIAGVHSGLSAMKLSLDGWKINCNGGLAPRRLWIEAFEKYESGLTGAFRDEFMSRVMLFSAGKVAVARVGYHYRDNPTSITRVNTRRLIQFLHNDMRIVDFVSEVCPDDREARVLAQRQLFHGIFNAYRLLNRFSFSDADRDYALELIAEAKSHVDWDFVRPHVSPRYYAILRNRLIPTAPAVRFVDFYRKLKK